MGGGTGLQNLRDCIQWAEEKFNFERVKMKKPFWKQMSVNFIERYCYLIVFATYLKENAPKGFEQSLFSGSTSGLRFARSLQMDQRTSTSCNICVEKDISD